MYQLKIKMINTNPILNVYENKSIKSKISTQLLYGEKFLIIKKYKKCFKIKNLYDGYIGYIKRKKYDLIIPTHKILSLKAPVYKKQKNTKFLKTKKYLPFASNIKIQKKEKIFSNFHKNSWLRNKDFVNIKYVEKNFIKICKLFLNTKYKWGGKTFKGIDCSALIQIFFQFNNIFVPRDTKDQVIFFNNHKMRKKFKKKDLIFWKGHVAICINNRLLIHAYGPKKRVLIMNIKKTINEITDNAKLKIIGRKKIENFT